MKYKLSYLLIVLILAACHKNEVSLKNVVSVSLVDDLVVPYGTAFGVLAFPAQATVTYSDNSTEAVNVTYQQGAYNATESGTYALEGILAVSPGTTNSNDLKAAINVIILPLQLKSVSQDGALIYEYFYDAQNRLDHFKAYGSSTDFYYTYNTGNRVTQRLRKLEGNDYPEKYFYHSNGTLDRIEFYYGDNILDQTHTYTYTNGKISKYENSDQSINTLKFRTFDYDAQGNIMNVSFDAGNPWIYTYFTDKKVATPLLLDWADPQNQTLHPVNTFTFVELSSYTSTYTYNSWNYPTAEVRTYPGNGNSQTIFSYTYE